MEKDVEAIKKAIESVKKSNWNKETKNATVSELNKELDSYYHTTSAFSVEREDALNLVKSAPMDKELKERMVESVAAQYDAELSHEQQIQKAHKEAIQKAIQQDPKFIATAQILLSTGHAIKNGDITESEAKDLLNKVFDPSRFDE